MKSEVNQNESAPAPALEAVAAEISEKLRALDQTITTAREVVKQRQTEVVSELEPWLDRRAAAKYLAMSVSTLASRLASRNAPPHTNDGGKLRFKPSELDAWLRQWSVRPRGRRV